VELHLRAWWLLLIDGELQVAQLVLQVVLRHFIGVDGLQNWLTVKVVKTDTTSIDAAEIRLRVAVDGQENNRQTKTVPGNTANVI